MELDGDRGDDSEEGDLGGGNGESGLLPAMSPMTLGSPLSTLESPPSDSAATFPSTYIYGPHKPYKNTRLYHPLQARSYREL
jgi:hypothetical protein